MDKDGRNKREIGLDVYPSGAGGNGSYGVDRQNLSTLALYLRAIKYYSRLIGMFTSRGAQAPRSIKALAFAAQLFLMLLIV